MITLVLALAARASSAAPVKLILPGAQAAEPAAVRSLVLAPELQSGPAAAVCPLAPSKIDASLSLVPSVPVVAAQQALPQLRSANAGLQRTPEHALSTLYDAPGDGAPIDASALLSQDEGAARVIEKAYLPGLRRDVARVQAALETSVRHGGWNGPGTTLHSACCGDAAPKLAYLLRKAGHPAHVVEAELHLYVVVELPGRRLFVDPSVRQFFGGASAPADVPKIFVGPYEQLYALFERRRAARSSKFPASRIYFSQAKTADSKIAELAARVLADPRGSELGPLGVLSGAGPN